ncbi:MAG: S49 family peptidase, partial [Acidobacteriia bacterium]|nr:S49 family peptidase [Terriglobia bacterium]
DHILTTENSSIDWPFQNFTPAQREAILKFMHDIYDNFLKGVAEGRHMDVAAVDKIAQGHVWSGERAKQLGLVDELGGLDAAIALAKKLADIPDAEQVRLVYLPPPKTLFERVREVLDGASILGPGPALADWLRRLEALARIPAWTLLPAVPDVQ